MTFLKRLILSYPMLDLVPDQNLIMEGQADGSGHICAMRGRSHAFVYIPTGARIKVQMGLISGKMISASWFNPRTGKSEKIGEFPNCGVQIFDPPGLSKELAWLQTGRGCDWVLVLTDNNL